MCSARSGWLFSGLRSFSMRFVLFSEYFFQKQELRTVSHLMFFAFVCRLAAGNKSRREQVFINLEVREL